MRVIQFAGWSKTGKTSLIEKVLRVVPQEMTTPGSMEKRE